MSVLVLILPPGTTSLKYVIVAAEQEYLSMLVPSVQALSYVLGITTLNPAKAADVSMKLSRMRQRLAQGANKLEDNIRVPDVEVHDDGYMCFICGRTFHDQRTCAVHLSRRHGVLAAASNLSSGTRCEVYGLEFWSNHRLVTHLRRTRRCFAVYWHNDMTAKASGSKEDRRDHANRPGVVTPGPRPFWAIQVH